MGYLRPEIEKRPPQSEQATQPFSTVDEAIARVVRSELERINLHAKRMISREEAAAYMGCSVNTVANLISEGRLTPSYYTRRPMLDIFEIDKLIEETRGKLPL